MSTIISLLPMRGIWVVFKGLKMAHIALIDLKKDLLCPILSCLTLPHSCILNQTIWLSTCTLITHTDFLLIVPSNDT